MARLGGVLLPLAILLLTVTAAAAADKPGKQPKADASPPPPANTPYTPPPPPPHTPQTSPPPPPQAPQTPSPPPPHAAQTPSPPPPNAPVTPSPTPGNSGNAPGHSGNAPGHSGEAPGHSGETPGHSGEAPGHASQPPPPPPQTTPPTPEIPPPTPVTPPPTPETPPPTPETPPPTPETSPPPPQLTPPSVPKPMQVKCSATRKLYPNCPSKMMECPSDCPQTCFADCNLCKAVCVCSVPGACGDPRFIGGDGNAFYFHGRKDADFCVLSDRDLHINAHFIGKSGGADTSRDFTWIQAIAVLFDGHGLYVGAKKTAMWDDDVDRLEVTLDGEPVHIPEDLTIDATWTSRRVPTLSVTRTKAANGVLVVLDGRFSVRANAVPITEEDSRVHHYGKTAEDSLAHLELAFKFHALTDDVHGVVGQTYRTDYVNRFDVKAAMPTMGGKDKFATSSLFAPDCAVARFGVSHANAGAAVMSDLAGVTCASGMDGQGVVCKK